MKIKTLLIAAAGLMLAGCSAENIPAEKTISKDVLLDKIRGGWTGKTIGCTFGGPTEFDYRERMMDDEIPLEWRDHMVQDYFNRAPGLYDDIYMDLTFVDVFDKQGLDAPVEAFANAFSTAAYPLWHANQQGRYNILNGILPPESGHWKNNPHADDIDFQIEADYAGLMSPGMVNASSYFADGIGHMMNYGDGWYGGVYVAAMYSLAFISDDVEFIVSKALEVIPAESKFYRCISDVIKWHRQYPDNWEIAWALCEKNHGFDIGCTEGVYAPLNINAVINSAYVVIGLLYGEGDFLKTMEISTRCGQDSDCNPSTAAGILGTMVGYSNIPEYWMANIREVEDRPFSYTDISLNKATEMSYNQALAVIEREGGKVGEKDVTIKCQQPKPVRLEQCFEGLWPSKVDHYGKDIRQIESLPFTGVGCVVTHYMSSPDKSYVAEVEVLVDSDVQEIVKLPAKSNARKLDLFFKYDLPAGDHTISFRWLNPAENVALNINQMIVYVETDPKVIRST